MQHFLELFLDPGLLLLGELAPVRVELSRCVLEGVGDGRGPTHGDNLAHSSLSIRTLQVFFVEEEAHDFHQLRLGVGNQVLEAHEQNGSAAEARIIQVGLVVVFHVLHAIADPPLPVVGVGRGHIEGDFGRVVRRVAEMHPAHARLRRVPHDHQNLIYSKAGRERHDPREVRLDYPASVVHEVFTLHTLHLQDRVGVQRIVRARWHSRQQLQVLAQERVARAGEGCEADLVPNDTLSVQKYTLLF
mmetsp:Transcript_43541/g.57640  ORF Transcript_43541/g.57640 Transcript_43541/m.57640 type:complete len:245 (+) Transcript_43541:369-1103(+)